MTVKSAPYYWLECDRCGVKSTEDDEFTAYSDVNGALESAEGSDWRVKNGEHYCDECWLANYAEEDEA